jgi:hypothetical protein
MGRFLLLFAIIFQLFLGHSHALDTQQFGFDTHSYLYQNGKLVGAVFRPKLGTTETVTEYTEYWILFKEFVRVGKLVNGKPVPTTVVPAKESLKTLKLFTNKYKNKVGNTYVTAYASESEVPFTESTSMLDNEGSINQHEPDGIGYVSQNDKRVGAHWRFGEKQLDGSYIEHWALASNFVYPSHRTTAAKKGMILKSSKDKVYSYGDFLSKVSTLTISKYVKVFCFESKIPFDQQP